MQELSKAVELDEIFAEAHLLRGDALKELEDYGAAIQSYSTAIDLKPEPKTKLAHALNGRGECYKESQPPFLDLAMNDFDSAYELDRRNADIAANYGDMLINVLRDARRAIRVLDKAIELDPENAEAWANRGWARTQMREFDESVADLEKAIELDPQKFEYYSTLANIHLYEEEYAPAIEALTKAIETYKPEESTDPDIFVSGYLSLADARLKLAKELKDPEKAHEQYELILSDTDPVLAEYPDQYPESGYALFRRGVALRMLERYSEAIKTLNDAIQLVPPGEESQYLAEAYLKRGICWHYQGQDALARGDFEQSASINYEDPLAQLWIGYTYAQEGDYRQAIDAYGEAISLNPKFSLAYVNRALAYIQVESYKKAIDNFNHAIRHEPSEASHYYLRGLTKQPAQGVPEGPRLVPARDPERPADEEGLPRGGRSVAESGPPGTGRGVRCQGRGAPRRDRVTPPPIGGTPHTRRRPEGRRRFFCAPSCDRARVKRAPGGATRDGNALGLA